ncbi:MAG: hypothetical protein [Caudoviricetes sp.]|nr:MAG: hypothetical protein [Caudoviricetes sp.]
MIPTIFLILYTSVRDGSSFMNMPMQSMESCVALGRNMTRLTTPGSFSHIRQYRYEDSNGRFDCLDTKNQILFTHVSSDYNPDSNKEVTIDLTK